MEIQIRTYDALEMLAQDNLSPDLRRELFVQLCGATLARPRCPKCGEVMQIESQQKEVRLACTNDDRDCDESGQWADCKERAVLFYMHRKVWG